jgi:uncharacterized protein
MSETGASAGGQPQRQFEGAGGTPGGLAEFFIGLGVAAVGFYLLFNHVYVQTAFGHPSGFGVFGSSFGLTLLPLLFGIGTLFVNGKSILGWALTVGGLLFIAAGILMNMHIYFRTTTLFDALVMFGLIAAGMGLIVKSLRPHKVKRPEE